MNLRYPIDKEDDLRFCSEEFKVSYPTIGNKALKWYDNSNLTYQDIKVQKGKLSKEGYDFGDVSDYGTGFARDIVVMYVERAMEMHRKNHTPLKNDECIFETDSNQLLIQMAEDRIKEKMIEIFELITDDMSRHGSFNVEEYKKMIKDI